MGTTYENNYFKTYSREKYAKLYLPSVTSPTTRFNQTTRDRIEKIAQELYSYFDQFLKVSNLNLVNMFDVLGLTQYRLTELMQISIWIHAESSILFSLGGTKEIVDGIFDDYIMDFAATDDVKILRYFLDVLTTFGFFSISDGPHQFLRSAIYNCITTAFIFEKSLLSSYVDLISSPGRIVDKILFEEVIISSYASRNALLYTANSAFFSQVEPNLIEILDSHKKEAELV